MSAQDGFDIFLSQLRPTPAPASVIAQAQAAAQAIQAAQAARVAQPVQPSQAIDPIQAANAALVAHEMARQPAWLTALQNPEQPHAIPTLPMPQSPLHFLGQVEEAQILPRVNSIHGLQRSLGRAAASPSIDRKQLRPWREVADARTQKEFKQIVLQSELLSLVHPATIDAFYLSETYVGGVTASFQDIGSGSPISSGSGNQFGFSSTVRGFLEGECVGVISRTLVAGYWDFDARAAEIDESEECLRRVEAEGAMADETDFVVEAFEAAV